MLGAEENKSMEGAFVKTWGLGNAIFQHKHFFLTAFMIYLLVVFINQYIDHLYQGSKI